MKLMRVLYYLDQYVVWWCGANKIGSISCWFVHCPQPVSVSAFSVDNNLDFRENLQNKRVGVASVITYASSDTNRPVSGTTSVKGYVCGNKNIQIDTPKRWLPMNHSDLPKLLQISFNVILPGKTVQKLSTTNDIQSIHYSKIPLRNNNCVVGHQQTALGGFLLVQQISSP